MSDLRQAAAAALEALEILDTVMQRSQRTEDAITALKQALAEPEPEQKVWCACGDSIEPDSGAKCGNCVAGDSAEPEQKPVAWVNAVMRQAQEFASAWSLVGGRFDNGNGMKDAEQARARLRAMLHAAPTPQPLTDEEIASIVGECAASAHRHDDFSFARAIEAAHGITGEQT